MSILWQVRIDLVRLQANLSEANRWPYTPDDVFHWLTVMGFRREGEWWITDGRRIDRLEPNEVIEKTVCTREESIVMIGI